MIKFLRERLFTLHYEYRNARDNRRARILVIINMLSLLGGTLWVVSGVINAIANPENEFFTTPVVLGLPIIFLAIHILVQRGYLEVGAWLYVGILTLASAGATALGLQFSGDLSIFLTLIAAAVVLERRNLLIVLFVLSAALLLGLSAQLQADEPVEVVYSERAFRDFFGLVMTVFVSFLMLYLYNSYIQTIESGSKADIDNHQKISAFIPQLIAFDDDDEDRAVARMLSFCMRELGYSFAQFFHVNADGRMTRRVRAGFGLQIVADITEDLEINEGSAVYQAAITRSQQLASFRDMTPRRRHFLPTTTYGIAIPVLFQGILVGVLDVQNNRDRAMHEGEIEVLSRAADGLGMAINVIRDVNSLRNDLRQEQIVSATLRSRVGNAFSRNQFEATSIWDTLVLQDQASVFGLNFSAQGGEFISANDLPDEMLKVIEAGDVHIEQASDRQVVTVPIILNREVLGAMTFNIAKGRKLTERQIEMTRIISRRLALALENRRLIEQTQSQAERERKANETANELIGSTDVRSVLERAADRFNEALGAIHTRIEVKLTDGRGEETA